MCLVQLTKGSKHQDCALAVVLMVVARWTVEEFAGPRATVWFVLVGASQEDESKRGRTLNRLNGFQTGRG